MLDAYSSDAKYAFQFDDAADLVDSWHDYFDGEIPEDVEQLAHLGQAALVILTPSGNGGWLHSRVVTGEQLRHALETAGLLPD